MRARVDCTCLLVLGAAVMFAASHELQGSSPSFGAPDVRQRIWPSWGLRPGRIQEDLVPTGGQWRGKIGGEDPRRPEQLTAVAAAEYAGTRAVAYAGFNHHHHQHHQSRESFTPGHQHPVTTAPRSAGGTYTKHHSGRRVCSRQAPASVSHHHRGRQIRLVYTDFPTGFSCCPGWTQVTRLSFGCNKPACPTTCLNGGTCIAPGKCSCPKQFTGQRCQFDVDECLTEKPCAQLCQNTFGAYKCFCRVGHQLQPDGQSCRKNDSDGNAFEARDLEADYRPTTPRTSSTIPQDTDNEVGERDFDKDYEFILKRLAKLEKLVARSKRRDAGATEMSAKINLAVENIEEVKRAVESVRLMQQEVNGLRNKFTHLEEEARRMQHVASRMTDLESRLRTHCGGLFNGNGRGIC